jgi:uncharacterized membrane protein
LKVLLSLSVALNVSFLAGAFWVHRTLRSLETAEGRARWAAREVGLDRAQREEFLRLQREWNEVAQRMRSEKRAEADAFWSAALAERPDAAALRARLEPLLEAQRDGAVQGLDHLLRVFRVLSPDQRLALVELLRRKERSR